MTNQASRSHNNLDNCCIIWLDVTINLENDSTQASLSDLRDTANSVLIFDELDECVDYITDVKDEKIFLILSGLLAIDILPLIYQAQQLQVIYILSSETNKYKQWAKEYLEECGVYSDIRSICRQLKQNMIQLSNELMPIKLMTSNLDDNELPASFMYSQILRDILLQMNDRFTAKQEMMDFCRKRYAGNYSMLAAIDKFDSNYRSDLAIWSYTQHCFVYKVLNSALRDQNTEILYKFRFFIRDLHEQIAHLHLSASNRPNVDTLYRCQAMKKTEFLSLRENALLSFSSFLSTTMNEDVANMYTPSDPDKVGVLFELKADANCSTCHTPFACIQYQSCHKEEDEVLFSMGSVFRINSIHQMENKDKFYRVQLIMTDADDKELNRLEEQIANEIGDRDGVFYLASLTRYMGKYDQSLHFYQLLLNDSSLSVKHPVRLSIIYNDMGCIYKEKKEYTTALEFSQKALVMKELHLPANDESIAIICSNIGILYCEQHMLDEALIYFNRAAEIDTNRQQNDLIPARQRLEDNNKMGILSVEKGDYLKALSHFQLAKQIENEELLSLHPDHAYTYTNIAGTYFNLSKYDEALFYLQKALEIQTRSQFHQHPRSINLLNSIAETYRAQENYGQALLYYEKALHSLTQSSPTCPSFTANAYQNIGDMHFNLERHEEAVKLYKQSLAIRLDFLKEDEESTGLLHITISVSLCSLGKFKESLENLKIAKEILSKTLAVNDSQLEQIDKLIEIIRAKVQTETQLQEK